MSNCCPTGGLPTPQVPGPATNPFDPCEDAQKVVVCGLPAPVPVAVPATTCGADTTVQAADALSQAVHTAPGTALMVKLCPTAQDREMAILCAPDGTKVMVQNVTPEAAPLGTAPVIEAWLLNGTPYAGAIADLKDCGAEKVDIAAAQWFCANGQNLSRTDFWDISVSPKVLIGSLWQDASGAVVTSPAPGTATVGTCSVVRKQLIYYRELVGGESLDISSIISDTGATTIHSIQVVHIDGEATLKGDTGSIPLDAFAPIWSHSSISGSDAQDQLTASAWTVVVDTGIVRVSAMYS